MKPPLVLGCALALSLAASAQVRFRPTEPGPWRPWSFTAIASARTARGASAADVAAFQSRLQELGAILKRAPAVAQPIGFAAEIWGNLDGYGPPAPGQPEGRAVPLAGGLSFGAFPLLEFTRNGRLVNEDMKGGETQLLRFVVNEIGADMYATSRPLDWNSQDIEGFFEPEVGQAVAGLPRLGEAFVVKKNPSPLWVPLPLSAALQPVIADRRAEFESRRDQYTKQVAEFAEWQTPAKRTARRADWQRTAAALPNGAEFLANMERSDREIEAATRERLAPGGPGETGVRSAERDFRAVESALSALTDEGRNAPSCYDERARDLGSRFRARAGAPASCRALVKPNWAYFDPRLPRAAPQVVMIASFTRCLTPESRAETSRGGCVINRALVESMDWDAVRAWLDK